MPLLCFLFEKDIQKFYTTKQLMKGFKKDEDNAEQDDD